MTAAIYRAGDLKRQGDRQARGLCAFCGLRPLVTTTRCQVCRRRHNAQCAEAARKRRRREKRAQTPSVRTNGGQFASKKETKTIMTAPKFTSLESKTRALVAKRGLLPPGPVPARTVETECMRVLSACPTAGFRLDELAELCAYSKQTVAHAMCRLVESKQARRIGIGIYQTAALKVA